MEKAEKITIKSVTTAGLVDHYHLSFLAKIASITALRAQAMALITSPCKRKYATQEDCPRKLLIIMDYSCQVVQIVMKNKFFQGNLKLQVKY